MLKYRHPTLGRFERLDLRKSGATVSMVAEVTLGDLVCYLNEARAPGHKKIVNILEEMLLLEETAAPTFDHKSLGLSPDEPIFTGDTLNPAIEKVAPEKYRAQLELAQRHEALDSKLRKYRFWPSVFPLYDADARIDRWFVRWLCGQPVASPLGEGEALDLVLELARAGYLNRLRRCTQCERWLYAKCRHQNFCSMKCQQKRYTRSEKFRAHRRQYMRDYYRRTYSATRKSSIKRKSRG